MTIKLKQNNSVLQKAITLAKKCTEKDLQEAENLILEHVNMHPHDTYAWLLLVRIEWNQPLEDFEKIRQWLNKILEYDPTNPYALLYLAHVYYENISDKLSQAVTTDNKVKAMLELAKAAYVASNELQTEQYEILLKKSIEYDARQSQNYRLLGKLYIKQGKIKEGNKLLTISEQNAKQLRLSTKNNVYDPTDIMQLLVDFYSI